MLIQEIDIIFLIEHIRYTKTANCIVRQNYVIIICHKVHNRFNDSIVKIKQKTLSFLHKTCFAVFNQFAKSHTFIFMDA